MPLTTPTSTRARRRTWRSGTTMWRYSSWPEDASGGSGRSSRLAQYSPPNPPPTTTTRGRPFAAMPAGYPPASPVHRAGRLQATPTPSWLIDDPAEGWRRASGPAARPSSSGSCSGGAAVADARAARLLAAGRRVRYASAAKDSGPESTAPLGPDLGGVLPTQPGAHLR